MIWVMSSHSVESGGSVATGAETLYYPDTPGT